MPAPSRLGLTWRWWRLALRSRCPLCLLLRRTHLHRRRPVALLDQLLLTVGMQQQALAVGLLMVQHRLLQQRWRQQMMSAAVWVVALDNAN